MAIKKISMTGTGGFIGSHFLSVCAKNNIAVQAIRDYKKNENIEKYATEKIINFEKFTSFSEVIKTSDYFVHAACIPKKIAENNEELSLRYGPQLTEKICEACIENQIPLIYLSSAQVYKFTAGKIGVKENAAKDRNSVYAKHKLLSENIIIDYSKKYKLNFVILRPFNIIGKNLSNLNRSTVENIFIKRVIKKQKIEFYSNPHNCMDFIGIDLVVKVIIDTMKKFHMANGQVINIGTGIPTSLYELAKYICGDLKNDLIELPAFINYPAEHLIADTTKMRDLLSIRSKNCLSEDLNFLYDEINK